MRQSESVKKNLPQQCDRQLFEKLKARKAMNWRKKNKHYLTTEEVNGGMARRDQIAATFQFLIAEKGDERIPY